MSATIDPVRFWARVAPQRLAIADGRTRWTYAELDSAVDETVVMLTGQGLDSGQHIALEFGGGQGLLHVVAFHALHRAGLLPVLIDARLTPAEREAARKQAAVDFVLASEAVPAAEHAASRPRTPPIGGVAAPVSKPRVPPPATLPDGFPVSPRRFETPAGILFTSGTESEPRAVVLTHGNFLWSALASARNLGVHGGDLWLCALPLHHVGGLSIVTRSAYYGTAVRFLEPFDPDAMNGLIDEEPITLVSVVPPMLDRLVRVRAGKPFPERLRAALVGGGAIPPVLLEEAAGLGLRALPTYGLTEAASQVTTLPMREWPMGLDSAGRPLAFTRVSILRCDGTPAATEEEGAIVVQGPTVMAGYMSDPEATDSTLRGHTLHTGDTGVWDGQGRLRVLDRRADRIVTGGENVAPAEVEAVLLEHPAIAEVCVVGVPSGAWGHEIAAAVVLRPGTDIGLEALRAFAGGRLAPFKLPRRLRVVADLPQGGSGKLSRRRVRQGFLDQVSEQKRT